VSQLEEERPTSIVKDVDLESAMDGLSSWLKQVSPEEAKVQADALAPVGGAGADEGEGR